MFTQNATRIYLQLKMWKSVILFAAVLVITFNCHAVMSQEGTTGHIDAIVKGRCFNYRLARSPGLVSIPDVDCDELWTNFSSAWTYRESCSQNSSNYGNLISFLNQPLPPNKSLFWEQTQDFAFRLANEGKRYVPIEATLIGYIADGLNWCGQTSAPGINYTYCPKYHSCPNETMYDFWVAASKWFASHAEGQVRVVLNGSIPGRAAYWRNSVFSTVELANLKSPFVTKLTALLVHDLDKPKVETCGTQSLLDLKADVLAKNIQFDCQENPPEVKYLLCADLPESPECKQTVSNNTGSNMAHRSKRGRLTELLAVAVMFAIRFTSRN